MPVKSIMDSISTQLVCGYILGYALWGMWRYYFRDVAQLGSAPRSGRGGPRFESGHPDIDPVGE